MKAFKSIVASSVSSFAAISLLLNASAAAQASPNAADVSAQPAAVSAQPPAAAAERAQPAADNPAPLIEAPVPGGLSADHVARRAAETSHHARAKTEEHAAAEAAADQAAAGFIPKLTGSMRYTRLSSIDQPSIGNLVVAPNAQPGPLANDAELAALPLTFPVVLNQYSVQAQLQVPLTDYALRLPQLYAAAKHNAQAAALLAGASRLRVATDARVLYYNWLRARLQTTVAARTLEQARQHLADARAAHEVGTASKADVLRVESQLASSELQLARSASSAELYEQQLHVVMHDRSSVAYGVGEDLRSVAERSELLARVSAERSAIAGALERRLEPRALSANATATRSQASAVLASELPRLDAVGSVTYANPNQRIFPQREEWKATWDVGLQLSWTPSDIVGAEANRSGTLARARQLDAERADLADSIEMEVRRELQSLKLTETALQTSERGVRSALESYRVRRALFQNGQATSVELTDAENEWSRAQLEVIGARIDRRIAEARLIHALGEDAGALAR